ncbi:MULTISPECIES: hypothetical protein [Microbacterium]|uniref:Uncharacterized protein n=1 Tax=Microbacterium hominis TaxID=162426 RepID=A0A2K9DQ95_9MICO|nr:MULTISPECIES: hypothetical protein [Microbacterium]AUG29396.1 hypothetical protein CXR34_07950 [Microbacterium hominis]EPD84078.1 hypothetical protein HMPREF1529_02118 [Microbacterium sp. oral taxon 186 str. F0373]
MTAQFALLTIPDGTQIEAESRTAIVDEIIPGHGTLPEGEDGAAAALTLREEHLADIAHRAQAVVMAALTEAGPSAISTLSEEALTAIYHDRSTQSVEIEAWESDIPLFLLATAYAPYTERPRPIGGQIVFLDPLNETTFLDSLVAAGFAELYTRDTVDET